MAITLDGTTGITSPGGDVSVSQSLSGNLTFTGTGNRITGDFSNATLANRVMFQTSTVNGNTAVQTIPNGTSNVSGYQFFDSTDPTNAAFGQIIVVRGESLRLHSNALGTASFLPITINTGGSERMRIDTSGNLLVGKTTTSFTTDGLVFSSSDVLDVTSVNDVIRAYRKNASGGAGVILTYSDVGGTNTLVGAGYANGTFGVVSDANKKKNIEDARSYLDDVMQLRVVKYNWITDEDNVPKELGWIAQEVEQVFPGLVSEKEGSKLLKKEVFLPMLMKCIQELKAELDTVKAELATLKG